MEGHQSDDHSKFRKAAAYLQSNISLHTLHLYTCCSCRDVNRGNQPEKEMEMVSHKAMQPIM